MASSGAPLKGGIFRDILRYLQDHLLGASLEVVLGVYPRNTRAAFV